MSGTRPVLQRKRLDGVMANFTGRTLFRAFTAHSFPRAALGLRLATALVTPVVGQTETVLSGLDGPVNFTRLLDDSIWWIEYYTGDVLRQDTESSNRKIMFHVEPVVGGERDLVALGVNQATADIGTFFLYYTVVEEGDKKAGVNHLTCIDDGDETILLTTTSDVRHKGGRIIIFPDGPLFVSTGENDLGSPAQDPESLLGKVLHILRNGKAAPANLEGRTSSLGHRNVYGLAYAPDLNRLFATENHNAERAEVNEIFAEANYGWPNCESNVEYAFVAANNHKPTEEPCDNPDYTAPIGEFYANSTVAPTGAAILDGRLYWASRSQGSIHRLDEMGEGKWIDSMVHNTRNHINDLEAGLDGKSLYYSNWTHIMRVPMDAPADATHLAAGPAYLLGEPATPQAGRLAATGRVSEPKGPGRP
jgi:glucose/arabinose dehydrogenase